MANPRKAEYRDLIADLELMQIHDLYLSSLALHQFNYALRHNPLPGMKFITRTYGEILYVIRVPLKEGGKVAA